MKKEMIKLEELHDMITNEIVELKKTLEQIKIKEEIGLQEFKQAEKNYMEIVENKKKQLQEMKTIKNVIMTTSSILIALGIVVALLSTIPISLSVMYLIAKNLKSLDILISFILAMLGSLLALIGVGTLETFFILPLANNLLTKIENYVDNLKRFRKIKELELEETQAHEKMNEKREYLEEIKASYQDYLEQMTTREGVIKYLNTNIEIRNIGSLNDDETNELVISSNNQEELPLVKTRILSKPICNK